ncbi:hypothetical protein N7527_002439 [Penicillium freii]|nr:hypothetical protein N7527_002439 [Penicillium freii]
MVERRTAGYIDGGRCETGGIRRQIPTGASGGAKPVADGLNPKWMDAIPNRAAAPRALNPTEGGAETGGGPANRNSTSFATRI